MTELQKITLRDVLRQQGLSERQIEDIFLLLYFKPENVKLAFYYVTIGYTQKEAGEVIGITQPAVKKYIDKRCKDIKEYLKLSIKI